MLWHRPHLKSNKGKFNQTTNRLLFYFKLYTCNILQWKLEGWLVDFFDCDFGAFYRDTVCLILGNCIKNTVLLFQYIVLYFVDYLILLISNNFRLFYSSARQIVTMGYIYCKQHKIMVHISILSHTGTASNGLCFCVAWYMASDYSSHIWFRNSFK